MFNFAKWLIRITFALLQLNKNVGGSCIIVSELYANCVNMLPRESRSLPNDLKKDIEVLNISNNRLEELAENAFAEFTKLKELVMARTAIISVSPKLFEPLTELQILNVSATNLGTPPARFPLSLKRLIMENFHAIALHWTSIEDLDFSELHYLEELYLKNSRIERFPNVPIVAPLVRLDLSGNPLWKFVYNDIAPFCRLKQVGLKNPTELSTNTLLLECCELQTWMKKYNITNDLKCATKNCTTREFNPEAIAAYEICIEDINNERSLALYGIIINIIICFAVMLSIGYLAWKYYRSHAVRYEHEIEKTPKNAEEEALPEPEQIDEE